MTFTMQDYRDMVRLLRGHPELRVELGQLILPQDILEMPRLLQELMDRQQRFEATTNARFDSLERDMREVKSDIAVLKADVAELKTDMVEVKSDIAVLKADMVEVKSDIAVLKTDMVEVKTTVKGLQDKVGKLSGDAMEQEYSRHCARFFGKCLRRTKCLLVSELEESLEDHLTDEEYEELLVLDLVVTGKVKTLPDRPKVWLAMEISATINQHDVERAEHRASLLRKGGYLAIPAVGGESIGPRARTLAQERGVVVSLRTNIEFWDEALEHYLRK